MNDNKDITKYLKMIFKQKKKYFIKQSAIAGEAGLVNHLQY